VAPWLKDALECPEEGLLLDFMAGALSAPDAARLHPHLDRCVTCCVALYEALHGQRPPGTPGGHQPALPRALRVPGHVRRALQRGLFPEAERRFASMRELLTALAREPLVAWRGPCWRGPR
jgi:hypothetical protein